MTTVAFLSDLHIDSNNFRQKKLETLITLFQQQNISTSPYCGDIANGFEGHPQEFLDQLQCHFQ